MLPVRPRPVWISSATISTRSRAQISATSRRYPSGGMRMPASHWIGSNRKAQVCGVMASSSASASPNGTVTKPGVKGPKPSR